jgi:hypothetical protein
MGSAELGRRVEKVVSYPPLSELDELQRREFQEALLEVATFEDLPGKWHAAIGRAELRPLPVGKPGSSSLMQGGGHEQPGEVGRACCGCAGPEK